MARRKIIDSDNQTDDNSPSLLNDSLIESLKREVDGVYVLGKDDTPADVTEWLSTGSTELDMKISNNVHAKGGIPVGRLTEIHGESSCVTEDTLIDVIIY